MDHPVVTTVAERLCSSDCWSTSTSCIEPGSANSVTGSNWPSKPFPGTSTNLPATGDTVSVSGTTFLDSSTEYYAYFKQIINGGDMKIVSIRTSGDDY
jgi:hypothetical protein